MTADSASAGHQVGECGVAGQSGTGNVGPASPHQAKAISIIADLRASGSAGGGFQDETRGSPRSAIAVGTGDAARAPAVCSRQLARRHDRSAGDAFRRSTSGWPKPDASANRIW